MQSTANILLIRPQSFRFNAETAVSNKFQSEAVADERFLVNRIAVDEFDRFAETLRSKGVSVWIFDDSEEPEKPDAVFPNNWVSFHADGTVVLYPMCAANRRNERRLDIVEQLEARFRIEKIVDLSHYENENRFLEGTGSIVFDHVNKIAYACLSPRTDLGLFNEVSADLGYEAVSFHAHGADGSEIYHTNVMMSVGTGFAVICLASIRDNLERKMVVAKLDAGNLQVIDISLDQMNSFAGNMLEVAANGGRPLLVLSQTAHDALRDQQKSALQEFCELFPISIPTIEKVGGGSARCMMAEIFLPELA